MRLRFHYAGRADQAQDGAAGHRLAGAGFADDAEPLAPDREGDAAHRLDDAGAGAEADAEVFDIEKRLLPAAPLTAARSAGRARRAARRRAG